jgi:hypothetical protein
MSILIHFLFLSKLAFSFTSFHDPYSINVKISYLFFIHVRICFPSFDQLSFFIHYFSHLLLLTRTRKLCSFILKFCMYVRVHLVKIVGAVQQPCVTPLPVHVFTNNSNKLVWNRLLFVALQLIKQSNVDLVLTFANKFLL